MDKKPKRPRDPSQLAKMIVDIASGEHKDKPVKSTKGRAGGLKGGVARALKLSPAEKSDSARKAALKRWQK